MQVMSLEGLSIDAVSALASGDGPMGRSRDVRRYP